MSLARKTQTGTKYPVRKPTSYGHSILYFNSSKCDCAVKLSLRPTEYIFAAQFYMQCSKQYPAKPAWKVDLTADESVARDALVG